METPEIIKLLRKDIGAWNAWRQRQESDALRMLADRPATSHPREILWDERFQKTIAVNLTGADFEGADLRGANLGPYCVLMRMLDEEGLAGDLLELPLTVRLDKANLCHADLRGADLRKAVLVEAKLIGAKFDQANLSGASLRNAQLIGLPEWMVHNGRTVGCFETDLSRAVLNNVDFTGARLNGLDLRGITNLNQAKSLRNVKFVKADLSGADLREVDLRQADLRGAHLSNAKLMGAKLNKANLQGADLAGADLTGARLNKVDLLHAENARTLGNRSRLADEVIDAADLRKAILTKANLTGVDLSWMDLTGTSLTEAILTKANLTGLNLTRKNLQGADLREADLSYTTLVETDLTDAKLNGCRVYGVSVWDIKLDAAAQTDLLITPKGSPAVQVDRLDLAQFVYLLVNNQNVRHVIDTITSKVVLILGRFTPERKPILDAIRVDLRKRDYVPVLFDFEGSKNRDITETVSTLAHMARFVIADITDARSIPQELMTIVPNLPSVPVQPLRMASQPEYGMFEHFKRYPSVLTTCVYEDKEALISKLEKVIAQVEAKVKEQTRVR